MLEDFQKILDAQRGALKSLEENEVLLMKVRDDLNEAIRNAFLIDVKGLLVELMKTESALLASAICTNQSQVVMAKQAISHQQVMVTKMQKQLDKLFGSGDGDITL